MEPRFRLFIKDVFFFQDGRTVLAGPVEGGEDVIIKPGACAVFVDGKQMNTIQIEGEMIPSRSEPLERRQLRAVSTLNPTGLNKAMVETQECILVGPMSYVGHRHLIGIDSLPPEFEEAGHR